MGNKLGEILFLGKGHPKNNHLTPYFLDCEKCTQLMHITLASGKHCLFFCLKVVLIVYKVQVKWLLVLRYSFTFSRDFGLVKR